MDFAKATQREFFDQLLPVFIGKIKQDTNINEMFKPSLYLKSKKKNRLEVLKIVDLIYLIKKKHLKNKIWE